VLFGCPIWMVDELVPASEWPIWRVQFAKEPWGFNAMDMLVSKMANQLAQLQNKLRPGTSFREFMFADPYETMTLSKEQFQDLSLEEQEDYVRRQIQLTKQVLD
jgi:hypothetical protein